ncbi:MAG: hypothetical protein ABDI19_11065 [Armatimonadota bacterium]
MEAWGHDLPEWAKAHLRQCPACAQEWQREQWYRRVLQAVRQEPVPVCQLRWGQVQARLATRPAQLRPFRWQFAFSGALASVFVLIVLGLFGFFYLGDFSVPRGKLAPNELAMRTPAEAQSLAKSQEAPDETRMLSIESLPPAVLKKPNGSDAVAPQSALPKADSKHASASAGEPKRLAMAAPPSQHPRAARAAASAPPSTPSPAAGLMLDSRREQGEPFAANSAKDAVALLPLPDVRPETAENAEYLPVQYGGLEESNVYSF